MSEDDDAPAETYVLDPEDLKRIRSKRQQARSQAMNLLLGEASELLDERVTSERMLYQLWAIESSQQIPSNPNNSNDTFRLAIAFVPVGLFLILVVSIGLWVRRASRN